MNATVKLLNGDLIRLTVDFNSNDSNHSYDLSTEGIKAYDVNSGERIYGGVELSFVLTREEIERLVHICSGHI